MGEEASEDEEEEVGDGGVASAGAVSSTGSVPSKEDEGSCDAIALELALLFASAAGLGTSTLGRMLLSTASKSGGGIDKSCLDAEAANATASGPYGRPNLPNVSLDEINLTWSGVGPERGYVNSVRIAVCVNGAEMELSEINDGEVSGLPWLSLLVVLDIVRDIVRNAERLIPEALELLDRCPRRGRPPLGVPCDSTEVRVTRDGPDPSRL